MNSADVMSTADWIGTSLSVFGFGFSIWAFMLKKAIDSLNRISDNLVQIDKRLSALEQWRQFTDEERRYYKSRADIE